MTTKEYNHCVDAYSDNVFRFMLKSVKDEELARDLVQDTFLKMWNVVETVDVEKAKSFLFTTAYRTMIDHVRRESKMSKWEEGHENRLSHENGYSDLQEILEQALNRLPADQKSVVMLRDYEGYSYKEIAEITSLTESQVKVYIFRARVTLKKYLVSIDYVA